MDKPLEEFGPNDQVLLCYDSGSHGKRRYYVADPFSNPAQDGKPQWTYRKKNATVLQGIMAVVAGRVCGALGYNGLLYVKPGPTFGVIDGGPEEAHVPDDPTQEPEETETEEDEPVEDEPEEEQEEDVLAEVFQFPSPDNLTAKAEEE